MRQLWLCHLVTAIGRGGITRGHERNAGYCDLWAGLPYEQIPNDTSKHTNRGLDWRKLWQLQCWQVRTRARVGDALGWLEPYVLSRDASSFMNWYFSIRRVDWYVGTKSSVFLSTIGKTLRLHHGLPNWLSQLVILHYHRQESQVIGELSCSSSFWRLTLVSLREYMRSRVAEWLRSAEWPSTAWRNIICNRLIGLTRTVMWQTFISRCICNQPALWSILGKWMRNSSYWQRGLRRKWAGSTYQDQSFKFR